MYIRKIKIEKFKSFYEPYELDFDQVKGLWKVSGSVGSGKTTIGEAILFGLFGTVSGKNNGDLVSWGQKTAYIELWCRSNGREIYIKREVHSAGWSSIYVEIDGEELIFTNKRDAQQQLESEYYDISRVTMELLCIISFNNFKSLATLNTNDTKKFLDQVLGFYTLTEYADACKKFRQENDTEINSISRNISSLSAQINKLNELSNIELIEGDIVELENHLVMLNDQLKAINDNYVNENKRLITIDNELRSDATRIKTIGAAKSKEIAFIEKGVCPTCGAAIDQSQLEIKRQERELLLKQYNDVVEKIKVNSANMQQLSNECNSSVKPIKHEIENNKDQLIRLREQAKRKNVNQEEIDKLQAEKDLLSKDYDNCLADSMSWERLQNILTSDVRAKILESFIPALNKNIMKYAQELHQPYIVSFDNSFKCSVSLCGYADNIPLSSLSTGQLKTVDMMIILGVLGTVIGSSSANVIFLDELFSNLDGGLRNDMCSVLHNFISANDTMFVISHQDLDERYFNGTLKLHIDHKGQFEKHSSVTMTINEHE
jgi:DNA repair exonuclease SbcCD ATPase subunit